MIPLPPRPGWAEYVAALEAAGAKCPRCNRHHERPGIPGGTWVELPSGEMVHGGCVRPGDFPPIERWKP